MRDYVKVLMFVLATTVPSMVIGAQAVEKPKAEAKAEAPKPAEPETVTVPKADYVALQKRAALVPTLVEQVKSLRQKLLVAQAANVSMSEDLVVLEDRIADARQQQAAAKPKP